MATYQNLPGVNLELLDGNLRIDQTDNSPRVLVIGRAEKGPTNTLYGVTDTNRAAAAFGQDSPLIRKMSEALIGGAKRVSLYRIGGKQAKLKSIFGKDSYLAALEASVSAADNLKVYVGPRPNNDGKACLIVFKGNEIVYSNVPGSEVNRNQVEVFGFDPETKVKIGTPTEPIPFADVILKEYSRTAKFVGNGTAAKFSLPGVTKTDTVTVSKLTVDGEVKNSPTDFSVKTDKETSSRYIEFTTAPDAAKEIQVAYKFKATGKIAGSAVFVGNGTKDEFVLPGTKKDYEVTLDVVKVAGQDKSSEATTQDDSGASDAKALKLQNAPADQASVIVEYTIDTKREVIQGEYEEGEDSINTTWKNYYELLHTALAELESVSAISVVTDYAIIDAPNIADGSEDLDRLDYVYVSEENGELKYEWSTEKVLYRKNRGTTTTSDPAEADVNGNGQPVVFKRYHEANFAHLLANFANTISENEEFCLVTIGASMPRSLSQYEVNRWIGSPATYDALGNIVSNGTGLLGLRNMVARADVRQGFYKTTSGFVDGSIVTDSNGAPINIGKFLSVVPQVIVTPSYSSAGSNTIVTNGAAVYAGLITTINASVSTTNMLVPRIALPGEIKKVKLDQLTGAGYVFFKTTNGSVRVVSDELATNSNSDYRFLSTTMAVAEASNAVRTAVLPFIGRGLTEATLAAVDVAIEGALQRLVEQDHIVKYLHVVNQRPVVNGRAVLDVALTIVPAFELREINVAVKLALEL
jgi:phage tail sheath protein|nr:MAG TPA: tail sheath protein [Caudoviricetes sp.]